MGFADLAISANSTLLALNIRTIDFKEAPVAMRLVSFRRLSPKGAPYLMANTDYAEKSQSS